MKIAYINDTIESKNWGAIAASSALKGLIKSKGGKIDVNVHQRMMKNFHFSGRSLKSRGLDFSKGEKYINLLMPPIIPKGYARLARLLGVKSKPVIPVEWDAFQIYANKCLKEENSLTEFFDGIENSDLVVINGEGCIFGNKFLSNFIFLTGYISGALIGKPTIIVNHWADYQDPDLLQLAEKVYPFFADVVVRDYASLRSTSNYCNSRYAADTSYCYKPLPKEHFLESFYLTKERTDSFLFEPGSDTNFNPAEPYICIGGSSLLCKLSEQASWEYFQLIKELKKLGLQVVLTASAPPDQKLFKTLSSELSIPLISNNTSVELAISILGHAELYIGGRWHPSNMAISGGTPVIPFNANTSKMDALAELQGLSDTVFNLTQLNSQKEEIIDLAKNYISEGDSFKLKMTDLADSFRRSTIENVNYLVNSNS